MGYNLKIILSYLKSSNLSRWTGIFKKLLPHLKSAPRIWLTAKFLEKQKCLNLGPQFPYLGILGLEFANNFVIFDAKLKILKFGTKYTWFGYFWTRIWKQHWNQRPRICLITKFHEKMKMPKFGTNNVLSGYFWA